MLRIALGNLRSRPVRSLLALLGLTVAIMGMVGLFSVSAGLASMADKSFQRIPGMIVMKPGAPIPLFSKLPSEWADDMAATPGVRTVCREVWGRAHVIEGKPTFSPPRFLFGADVKGMLHLTKAVYRDDMLEGRFLQPADRGTTNCVISLQIAEEYKKHLGDSLRVDGRTLTIVGIYETGSIFLDVAILVEQATARAMTQFEPQLVSSFYVEPDGTVTLDQLEVDLRERFRGRATTAASPELNALAMNAGSGQLLTEIALALVTGQSAQPEPSAAGPDASADVDERIEIRSALAFGERIQEYMADLDIFLWLMNLIGVVIALLSILNTMLMSVSERIIEFGVLRANGWSAGDVIRLIVAESAVLGVCGGVCGCLLGWSATHVVNFFYETKLFLYASPTLLAVSLVFATVLGMCGGAYPAWLAVRMSPMEAIRRG
jgi:putative ABC transport system permease protein